MPVRTPPPAAPGPTDTVPAWLTPGEYVIKRDAVRRIGVDKLNQLNQGRGYKDGGTVTKDPPLDTKTDEQVVAEKPGPPAGFPAAPIKPPLPEATKNLPELPSPGTGADSTAKPEDKGPPAGFPAEPIKAGPPTGFPAEPIKPPATQQPGPVPAPPTPPQGAQPQVPQTVPEASTEGYGASAGVVAQRTAPTIAEDQPTTQADIHTKPPPQPMQPTGQVSGIPTGTPDQPWGPELSRDEKIAALIDAGKTSGEAQAMVDGREPTTISGNKPEPKKTEPAPADQQPDQTTTTPPVLHKPIDTLKADEKDRVDPVQLYSYLLGKFANSGLVGYVPPDGARWGIKTGSAAEWAAFGLAVAKQESGLNTRSFNAADPGGSAGLFQFGQGQKPYVQGDQFDPQQSADAFVRAVQHYLANKGSVANMGEIFGSIRRPDEAGQYIAGAQKVAAGGDGRDLVSSGGGGGGGGRHKGEGGAGIVPMATTEGGNAPNTPQFTPPSSAGGDRYATGHEAPGGGGGGGGLSSLSWLNFGKGGGQDYTEPPEQQYQPQRMSVSAPMPSGDQGQLQNPMVQALMQRGFSPQEALQFAQSSANVAPGKGVQPLKIMPPAAPGTPQLPAPGGPTLNLNLSQQPAVQPKLVPAKQLMPSANIPKIDPSVVLGLMKKGFTREQAMAVASKASVSQGIGQTASFRPPAQTPAPAKAPPAAPSAPQVQAPARQPQATTAPPPAAKPPSDQPKPKAVPQPREAEPTEFRGGAPGSTRGNPTPPGHETILETAEHKDQADQHAAILSPDDPRVTRQKDRLIKGEHFVEGDPFHERIRNRLPYGKGGRQDQILGQAQAAIADMSPMHISYLSAPKEAEKFPTRESRKIQYEKHSPEARLLGKESEGIAQLVGHSMLPVAMGVKLGRGAKEPHQGYIQGISTNVMANNFQHINDKLEAMGRKSPYKELGPKFYNDLRGYYSNLLAGHTATGRGYATGTEHHPNEPARDHVPYKLSRKEADFINAVINNTGAFAKHEDAQKIRELARVNGTLITPQGETNQLLHDIEQADPGWSGRGSGEQGRVLEPSIRTFKTGLIHEIHPSEEHMPETIRPGKQYQDLSKAVADTSHMGRPDIPIAASLHHNFADNKKINQIERDFSEHKIDEAAARERLKALGEDPDEYRYIGGSGGLITPYEDDPEALTLEEHTQMKDNLRQSWVSGKMGVEDYRKKSAEVPLPSKPSQPKAAKPVQEQVSQPVEAPPAPKPIAPKPPKPPKPQAPPKPEPESTEAPEEGSPQIGQTPTPPAPEPPGPGEPLPAVKPKKPKAVKAPEPEVAAPTGALEKPSWKTANEKTRQAYLKQRVAQDLAKQYKGADAHPLEVDKNDDKSIKYDPAGNPIYKKIDYDLANSPLLKQKGLKQIKEADKHEDTLGNLIGPDGKEVIDPDTGKPVLKHAHLNQTERKRLSAMHTASAVHTMGNKIVDEFMNNIKDQPDIMAGEGWYSRMREKLKSALGDHHELFAQLLGATSAKTPVRNNFIQSLDALEQYKSGKFDNHIKKYLEAFGKMQEGKGALVAHMKNQGIPLYDKDGNKVDTHDTDAAAMANWVHHHKILPRQQLQAGQEEGSKYNANSMAVLRALAGTWLKEVDAPKTPNFAGNLTGRTLEATIDVWAARFLKRLGYEGHGPGPWRSQGKSEPGVNALDFAFSQDAMRHAADEITRRTGKKMNPDDLQAIAWFAEKHHWEKQGWTRGAGAEKSSFDDVADLAFPKTGEAMTSADLRKHYAAIQEEQKRIKARVKTAKTYVGHADPKMRAKLEPYMAKHGLTHEQVHGPEAEEDEDEAA